MMSRLFKRIQLWLRFHYMDIKHWLFGASVIILLVFSMVSLGNQNRLNQKVALLAEQNTVLSTQNKTLNSQTVKLSQENQSIAKQNRAFVLCGFQVFAKYTRDGLPIQNLDLATCTTDSQTKATNDTTTSGTSTSSSTSAGNQDASPNSSGSASSGNNTTTQSSGQSNTSQPDNDGIIVDLPLLPKIHIPSPL